MREEVEVKRIVHRTPEAGDKFYFYGGRNGFYGESTLGPITEEVREHQAYELRPMGCHYHDDGCHPDSEDHKIVKRTYRYAEVFGGKDSLHQKIDFRKLKWDESKNMWNAGWLS